MSTQPNTPSSNKPETKNQPEQSGGEQVVSIRRAPNLLAFGITGAVIGVIIAAILTFAPWPEGLLTDGNFVDNYTTEYSTGSVLGVLAVVCAAIFGAIAVSIALLLDRRSAKRAEKVRAVPTDEA